MENLVGPQHEEQIASYFGPQPAVCTSAMRQTLWGCCAGCVKVAEAYLKVRASLRNCRLRLEENVAGVIEGSLKVSGAEEDVVQHGHIDPAGKPSRGHCLRTHLVLYRPRMRICRSDVWLTRGQLV